MNKKFLGIKISTILQFVACLFVAVFVWFVVQYNSMQLEGEAEAMLSQAQFILL